MTPWAVLPTGQCLRPRDLLYIVPLVLTATVRDSVLLPQQSGTTLKLTG
jgi:hypothetical protein